MIPSEEAEALSRSRRLRSLAGANRVRSDRAELKAALRRGELRAGDLIAAPPRCLESAGVTEVLLAVPGLGKVKVRRLLTMCRISPAKRLRDLTERQRVELVRALGPGPDRGRAFGPKKNGR
jgi:hypothetical protein